MDFPHPVMWSANRKWYRSSSWAFQNWNWKWQHLEQSSLVSVRARWLQPKIRSIFGQTALLHLDRSNPGKDIRRTLPKDWPKVTNIPTQTTGDTSLERWIPLTMAHEASTHQTYQSCGLNHRTFWALLRVSGVSPKTVILTYNLHKRHNFRRLSLRLRNFQHELTTQL